MSIRVTTQVWERYPGADSELLLALALADHAHDDGAEIWPSVPTLAKKTRQTPRNVQKQLASMRKNGWLIVVERQKAGRGPTVYRINPGWLRGEESSPLNKFHPTGVAGDVPGVKNEAERGVLRDTPGVSPATPESSFNHQEPSLNSASNTLEEKLEPEKQKRKGETMADYAQRITGKPLFPTYRRGYVSKQAALQQRNDDAMREFAEGGER